ncbi:Alcohol dehydrogenase superfamily, zinc-type [Cordyceps fumosorosea ARSEF 2679]|uniref:Alcohol dehydrogenase superfamily, zinc-type n=1 Tax=Cordyceps fumosorosea (strain ARSEF 2679) TaxID=1081104 RepID=A0A168EQC9_CORFA|nr:Alcohol dehydrogenase superfamily, zinc-type [Cordyceps fumosorosea ARSEF 2679]OAA74096.1 Alcohol dehydrogenase superfamily, zinc-type [Cordyceps fumosorosea ARSEF 2679]
MTTQIPATTKQWTVSPTDGSKGFDVLKLSEVPVTPPGDSQVLVKIEAASLNYRDLLITRGTYPWLTTPNVVPGSDGAGTVLAVGKHVTRFRPGDKVLTLFNQAHIGGPVSAAYLSTGLGGALHGTLRGVGAFNEHGLVHMPAGLSAVEAAALPCAALTAWNALEGVRGGQWVLTQGTGGVSVAALQFAKAAGARVIATTGSKGKEEALRRLGADHVLNYNEVTDWGAKAKAITGGAGVDHVVEVAGPASMRQSIDAVRVGGVVSIIGFVGGAEGEKEPSFLETLTKMFTARGVAIGSRLQLEDMCRAIEANPDRLRPVVDDKVFGLEQLKEAYEYLQSGKHFGKVCIKMD